VSGMNALHDIELSRLRPEELSTAAGVAARGMRDNPSSRALFGDDPIHRVRALRPTYQLVLASLQRPALVARRRGTIAGIAALAPPGACFFRQMVARQKSLQWGSQRVGVTIPHVPRQLLLPLLAVGPGGLGRLSTWGEAGLTHDPAEQHQHVELVVVEAVLQGLGIGRLMMEALCREIDQSGEVSYLETDKPENVRFYEQFGFRVTDEATILETRNWYMQRPPAT
jgi:GNAT superfamily N-acetyltransferase